MRGAMSQSPMKWITISGLTMFAILLVPVPALAGPPRHYPRGTEAEAPPPPPPPAPRNYEQGQFRLWLGMYAPKGGGDYFPQIEQEFTGTTSDFQDVTAGGDVLWSLNQFTSIGFSLSTYEGSIKSFYREAPGLGEEFVTGLGHTTKLNITPLTLDLVLYPGGRGHGVTPYIGFGGGLFFWKLRETGDFCDLSFIPCEPFYTEYSDSGTQAGAFAMAGLDFNVRPNWSIFAEGRYNWASATLEGDFADVGKLDLSGYSVAVGFAWKY